MGRITAPVAPGPVMKSQDAHKRRSGIGQPAAHVQLQAAHRSPRRPRRDRGARPPARNSRSAASPTRPATLAPPFTAARPRTSSSSSATAWATQEVTAARYYQYGAAGHRTSTGCRSPASRRRGRSSRAAPPYQPDYDPDSASTGTMWATGDEDDRRAHLAGSEQRDRRARARTCRPCSSARRSRARRSGNVSTAEITDATPAVLDSHISLRGCQGPTDTRQPVPDGDQGRGRPRLDRRADRRPPRRRGRWAAGATASRRRSRGGRDAGKTVEQSAARQGYHGGQRRRRPRGREALRPAAARPLHSPAT